MDVLAKEAGVIPARFSDGVLVIRDRLRGCAKRLKGKDDRELDTDADALQECAEWLDQLL